MNASVFGQPRTSVGAKHPQRVVFEWRPSLVHHCPQLVRNHHVAVPLSQIVLNFHTPFRLTTVAASSGIYIVGTPRPTPRETASLHAVSTTSPSSLTICFNHVSHYYPSPTLSSPLSNIVEHHNVQLPHRSRSHAFQPRRVIHSRLPSRSLPRSHFLMRGAHEAKR